VQTAVDFLIRHPLSKHPVRLEALLTAVHLTAEWVVMVWYFDVGQAPAAGSVFHACLLCQRTPVPCWLVGVSQASVPTDKLPIFVTYGGDSPALVSIQFIQYETGLLTPPVPTNQHTTSDYYYNKKKTPRMLLYTGGV